LVREAVDGGTLSGRTDDVESAWATQMAGSGDVAGAGTPRCWCSSMPCRRRRWLGTPAWRNMARGCYSTLTPKEHVAMSLRRCSVLIEVHQWTGERDTVMRCWGGSELGSSRHGVVMPWWRSAARIGFRWRWSAAFGPGAVWTVGGCWLGSYTRQIPPPRPANRSTATESLPGGSHLSAEKNLKETPKPVSSARK
jgi:hypothetical protein